LKTIIQLLIAGLLLHGCVRAGESAWRFYSYKDAVEQEVLFGTGETVAQLQQRVVDIAGDRGIEMALADVEITRDRGATSVAFAYVEDIPLVPMVYTREHLFEGAVSARTLRGLTGK